VESSGGEKTLHVLNVGDMLVDRRDWEQPRGEGETERGDWSRFFGKSTGGKTHLNLRSPHHTNATRMDRA
jgi:hypothetical protein